MAGKIVFVFCANYLKEAQAAVAAEQMDNAVVLALPARCGNPPLAVGELRKLLESLPDVDRVEVFTGASCASQLSYSSEQELTKYPLKLHSQEWCFSLVADASLVHRFLDKGCYLVTPGWLAGWTANIERMGFGQTSVRLMMAETITSIVMFDTGVHDSSHEPLRRFAEYVNRPFEIVYTGISVMRLVLAKAYSEWQMNQQQKSFESELQDTIKHASINSMTIDLMSRLVMFDNEAEAIEAMMDVYSMLFAPKRLCYLNFSFGQPGNLWVRPYLYDDAEKQRIRDWLSEFDSDGAITETGDGFVVRAGGRGVVKGVVVVEKIAFPEHAEKYLSLARSIVNICILPVINARRYEQIAITKKELQDANEKLVQISRTDALTGIANRRAYDDYLDTEWKRMMRGKTSLALILCDIDFFKKYNDRYGHEMGDVCLRTVAQIIKQQVARPGDFVARYGGEEFAVILPETSVNGALHVAENIRRSVEQHCIPHEDSLVSCVTLSLGVSQVQQPIAAELSSAALFQQADIALYQAKSQGRNRVTVKPIPGT